MIQLALWSLLAVQDEVKPVERGTLTLSMDAEGTFEAVEPFEVRLKLKAYLGELVITSTVGNGAGVRQGATVLGLDTAELQRQIDAAQSDLAVARATLEKAQKDAALQEKSDALALATAEQELKNAEAAVKYWETLDGPHMLKNIDIGLSYSRDSVADQEEELEQLRKMYKSEELTTETSEIVVKRALRALERGRVSLKMAEEAAARQKEHEYPNAARRVKQGLEYATTSLGLVKNAQALGKISREAELGRAKAAVAAAEERAAKLASDLEALTVKAPFDGTLVHAAGTDPHALQLGERVMASQVLATVYRPGKMKLVVDVPESQLAWVGPGMKAEVTATSQPGKVIEGKTRNRSVARAASQNYTVEVELPDVDAALAPGMKASVHIDAGERKDALLVPSTAVSKNRVWVRGTDGVDSERAVVVGDTDGAKTVIVSGLKEGESVLVTAKK